MKFGGASLASPHHIQQAALTVLEVKERVGKVVVVVSAMGDMTDQLYAVANTICTQPPERELDMLVSSGERISMALLAMALKAQGCDAVSFTGSQSGIITSIDHQKARIKDLKLERIQKALDEDRIVIVAGFQGMSLNREITTLGRGGSDTSSVALGIGLRAKGVVFYKDVLGVYTRDPKKESRAELLEVISHAQACAMSEGNDFVIHHRALVLAGKYGIPLSIQHYARELRASASGTEIISSKVEPLTSVTGYE
ncbi:aspartate kinase [Candidatus Aerophobetes bacterium]|uniref:aspartate kinase n=1 Tax=Aerophobetes bacterium TaxID=2030807 RepID=A0A2A4X3V0_UNCAE|nr:MAG: aspartate kinase [Candidatus Aerophobetes bacterium]